MTTIQVAPGVHQLKVPIPNNPLEYLLSYLIEGEKGWLMVDTGWPGERALESVLESLQSLGLSQKRLSAILVTHAHPDHYGLAGRLRELSGAPLAMYQREAEFSQGQFGGGPSQHPAIDMARWLLEHGMPRPEVAGLGFPNPHGRPFFAAPDVLLQEGPQRIDGVLLEIIWTPGHSPGHMCLYDPQRQLLFAGDHVLPVITPHVSLLAQPQGNPLGDFLASLDKVADLPVGQVLPAHEHAFPDLRGRIAQIKTHHERRMETMLAVLAEGPKTAYEVASKVKWDVGAWSTMGVWLRRAALGETLAHLEHLRRQGRVATETRDGLVRYVRM
ncbi:MAG: MBL fold metallo-hydrolase [Chloroflexi bacterium]|nr:MBL fold metallo-hydrolase [Chloroflexota bacterium]